MPHREDSKVRKILAGPFGILILAIAGLLVVAVMISLSSRNFGEWSFDEVARIPNPKTLCDAVLVETNGGATTSFGYLVFVLPRGKKPKRGDAAVASLYGAVRSESAYGVNLRWQAEDALTIEYLEARDADLRNAEVNVSGHAVKIMMKAGITDSAARPGGMAF